MQRNYKKSAMAITTSSDFQAGKGVFAISSPEPLLNNE